MRNNERAKDELRKIKITKDYITHPEGSVLIEVGNTKVICNASIEDRVPPFMRGQGKGWITAEYSMLPRATEKRNIRESSKGKVSGRTMEIQRLIGRALRSVVNLEEFGERTVWIDCDVIQADGGTRTASITGAFVAMVLAFGKLLENKTIQTIPVTDYLAATSVGVLSDGEVILDLDYIEDSSAAVDMNIVMTGNGEFVEIQGTGEEATFTKKELITMLAVADSGMNELFQLQKDTLGDLAASLNTNQHNEGELNEKILIATKNKGKIHEFKDFFQSFGIEVKSLLDFGKEIPDIAETGTTFEENAAIKAEEIAEILDQPVLADDSGLMVDALNGEPGIYSARYAGKEKSDQANNEKLLKELAGVPKNERTASFVCVLAIAQPGKETILHRGDCEGEIDYTLKGENGFGYDPLFIPKGYNQTMAELSSVTKNSISHRSQAMKQLEKWLKD